MCCRIVVVQFWGLQKLIICIEDVKYGTLSTSFSNHIGIHVLNGNVKHVFVRIVVIVVIIVIVIVVVIIIWWVYDVYDHLDSKLGAKLETEVLSVKFVAQKRQVFLHLYNYIGLYGFPYSNENWVIYNLYEDLNTHVL